MAGGSIVSRMMMLVPMGTCSGRCRRWKGVTPGRRLRFGVSTRAEVPLLILCTVTRPGWQSCHFPFEWQHLPSFGFLKDPSGLISFPSCEDCGRKELAFHLPHFLSLCDPESTCEDFCSFFAWLAERSPTSLGFGVPLPCCFPPNFIHIVTSSPYDISFGEFFLNLIVLP